MKEDEGAPSFDNVQNRDRLSRHGESMRLMTTDGQLSSSNFFPQNRGRTEPHDQAAAGEFDNFKNGERRGSLKV